MAQACGRLASTVPPPEGDIVVKVREREREGREWIWKWDFEGGGVSRFEM